MLRNITIVALAFLTIFSFEACSDKNSGSELGAKVELTTKLDSVAYIIGSGLGEQLKNDDLKINIEVIAYGLKAGMDGAEPLFDKEQIQKIMQSFQEEIQMKKQGKTETLSEENKIAGEKFLAENKDKPGVITLENGCQYEIIKSGNGPSPKVTDKVRVHYHGTLINDVVFDSSVDRGEPAEFPLDQVIPGWTETIPLMKVGDKWKIFIPADKAYGEQGPQGIPGNSVLIFEVELLEILTK